MNSKPTYRVATAGLDRRDVRLIDIVFRHSQYNRVSYTLVPVSDDALVDILIVNPFEPDGLRTLSRVRARGAATPLVTAVPAGMQSPAQHAIHIERLTLQLLPVLNRLVEQEFEAATQPAQVLRRPGQSHDESGPDVDDAPDTQDTQDTTIEGPPSTTMFGTTTIASTSFADSSFVSTMASLGSSSNQGDFNPTLRAVPVPPASILSGKFRTPEPPAPPPVPVNNVVQFPKTATTTTKAITVLVVDDSPTVRRQMSLALNRMGLHCEAVSSAAAALEKLTEAHYELAMVDVVMPDMDGYRLTRELRRKHKSLPVIILTSRSSPFDLARGALAGCSAYLVKPVPLKKIEATVMKQLRKSLAIDDLSELIGNSPTRRRPKPQPGSPAPGRRGANDG